MISTQEMIIIDGQSYVCNLAYKLEARHLMQSSIAPDAYCFQGLWFSPLWEIKNKKLYLKGLVYSNHFEIYKKPYYMGCDYTRRFRTYIAHNGLLSNLKTRNQIYILHSTITVLRSSVLEIVKPTVEEIAQSVGYHVQSDATLNYQSEFKQIFKVK